MLSADIIIMNILTDAKKEGNQLLQPFTIQHPSNRVAQESNSIFVACVSSENELNGLDFDVYRDLVEILIVTKQLEYSKAIQLIKTICSEICKLIMENHDRFPNKPVIRSINPEYNRDYVLTRGHIMVQVKGNPEEYNVTEDEYEICKIILNDIIEE